MPFEIGSQRSVDLARALAGESQEEVSQALDSYAEGMYESMRQEYLGLMAQNDSRILEARGYKRLTAHEQAFWKGFVEAGKSARPREALVDLLSDVDHGMPESLIIDVFTDMLEERPLLGHISSQYVSYITRWLLNDQAEQYAAWGAINSAITQEITQSFKAQDWTLYKLSAFSAFPLDMLDLGYDFIEAYVRRTLAGSIGAALEKAILTGDGNGKPIGVNRDISEGVTVTGGAYPEKAAVAITDFSPVTYGSLLAQLSKKENGKPRNVSGVLLACSAEDYFTKVMPSTTVLNTSGAYVPDLFPFPTAVVRTTELPAGSAALFLPSEYHLNYGAGRSGQIELSDEYRFLEDQRVLKFVLHAYGRMWDNTSSIMLDISGLEPAFISVKEVA